jgi:hypothetical protein
MTTIETLQQLVDWIALNFNDPSAMIIKSKISEIIDYEINKDSNS